MTKAVGLDFIKTLPLRRESLTHSLTLLFGAAIAGLGVILYRRWNVQPTELDLAKKAYAEQKYQDTLDHCDKALRLNVGSPSEIHLLCAKAHIGLEKYDEAIGACGLALADCTQQKKNPVFLVDLNLQWGKALASLGHWAEALEKYDLSWKTLSVLADPLSSPRLKSVILVGMAHAYRKTNQNDLVLAVLDKAYANLYILNPSEDVSKEYRGLFILFYYTRIYHFIDTGSYTLALLDCATVLKLIEKPSDEQELDLKAEILALQSLLLAKKRKTQEAFNSAMKVLQLSPVKGATDRKAHLSIVITNKEILAATYFLCALCSSSESSTALHCYKEALKNAEIDEFLKAAILFKRGDFYLKLAQASSDEKAMDLSKTALEEFEAAQKLVIGKVVPESDLLKSLLSILELTNLEQKIAESLKDQSIAAAKFIRDSTQHR